MAAHRQRRRHRPHPPYRTRRGPPRLAEARARGFRSAIASEGELLKPGGALARPAPTPGSYNCRLIKLGNTTRRGPAFEKFKPFFCYVEVENNLLTIVKQTGSERPAGRLWEDDNPVSADLPRQPGAGRRAGAARLWRRSQARHGRSARTRRAVRMAAGDSVAARHVEARRVRADPGRRTAQVAKWRWPIPDEVRAHLIAAAAAGHALTYSELLERLGYNFSRPKMRALCVVLGAVDDEAEARGEPELAVLVVRQSDGLPGQGWWVAGGAEKHGHAGLVGRAEGAQADRAVAARGVRLLGRAPSPKDMAGASALRARHDRQFECGTQLHGWRG